MKKISVSRLLSPVIIILLMSCSKTTKFEIITLLMPDLPEVITYAPEDITTNTAELSGRIVFTGGGNISESGIHIYPTGISAPTGTLQVSRFNEKRLSQLTSEGFFSIYIGNLRPNTTYHYRAFATNETGTGYGEMKILVTSFGTVSDREGNQYQTVKIGDQIWMRENLRSKKYPDGTEIKGNCDLPYNPVLGRFYTWQTVKGNDSAFTLNTQICPAGWHVPTDNEWKQLLTYTGIPSGQLENTGLAGTDQAIMLKESGSKYWNENEANNSTGFSVLPAGICQGNTETVSVDAAFWTSTPFVYYGFMSGSDKIIKGNVSSGDPGLSVRCISN